MPHSADQVLRHGVKITFRSLEINRNWIRPLYIPIWHSTSWNGRRFGYIPQLIENNRHRVFIYRGGGSYWFDLSPAMGFTDDASPEGIAYKAGDEIAIIALESHVDVIKKWGDQVAIVIKPALRGYHVVAIPSRDGEGCYFQVVTPEGFELERPITSYSIRSYQ
jgi:hypothetical protein